MLKIAVCDDTPQDLNNIVSLINQYSSEKNIVVSVDDFKSTEKIFNSYEKEIYHIYILNMVMSMVSGLELVKQIRRKNPTSQIVYIITKHGFTLDAYAVNNIQYLIKPVDKCELFDTLDKAVQQANVGTADSITIKTRDGLYTISTDTILCAEYNRHKVCYTLVDGNTVETVSLTQSFSKHIAPLISDKRFISPHASFLINMSYVTQLNKSGFTMINNIFVPVSGKQYTLVRNTYINFRLGEAVQKSPFLCK